MTFSKQFRGLVSQILAEELNVLEKFSEILLNEPEFVIFAE